MNDHQEQGFHLEIIELNEQSGNDDADRLKAARQKTEGLFRAYRRRFTSEPTKASYNFQGEEVIIDSTSMDQVQLTRISVEGTRKVFDLDVANGLVVLNVTLPQSEPQPEVPAEELELQNLEEMAQFLFACDRVVLRGRSGPT